MRVISQNGEFDFPYEQIVVQRNENIIFARLVADSKARNTLGEYETPEKAEKAMEMCRSKYAEHYYRQGGAMATANFYVPPFGYIPPKIFKFPADSEVTI